MYGERPEGKKIVHVKIIDGTPAELKNFVRRLEDGLGKDSGYQFVVTTENIEFTDLNKMVEKLARLK